MRTCVGRWSSWRLLALLLALALFAGACAQEGGTGADDEATAAQGGAEQEGDTLQAVRDRGTLNCGINGEVPGFGFVAEDGTVSGFDVDYCKAVAAAVLDDPGAVEYKEVSADERFTALQTGEIDVLIRNTTWTATRDGSEGATFATTTFYDGQGMMVNTDADISSLEDLQGATVCVLEGTTTQLNLTTVSEAQGLNLTPQVLDDNDAIQEAFTQGQCQGWTSDKSQLAALKSNWPEAQGGPDALTILDVTLSKEPLGPVTRDGDSQWSQVVDWVVISTMLAEEFGITQDNVEGFETDDPDVQRFLGQPVAAEEGEQAAPFDPGLGLAPDFAVKVISAVGNYEEIYNRNVGPDTPLGLERGPNELYTNGGLHYPPPYR